MSLIRNISFGYFSQFYMAFANILMLPFYLDLLGSEAYGLIGFFAVLQSIFTVLDVGMSSTLVRASARYQGNGLNGGVFRAIVKRLELVFLILGLFGGVVLFLLAPTLSNYWLKSENLSIHDVVSCIELMSVVIAFRWMSSFYRGILTGSEKIVFLSNVNVASTTFKFLLPYPIIFYMDGGVLTFFCIQVFTAVVELYFLHRGASNCIPEHSPKLEIPSSEFREVLSFSLTIGFTSAVWILTTQIDKLILSKVLSLSDYGYFTVAAMLAGGVSLLSAPVSAAVLPRLTRLVAEGKRETVLELYHDATRLVACICAPAVIILCVFSREVLWVWTGNIELAEKTAAVLSLYAAGYGILTVSAFPYYLQYAMGSVRLHLLGNVVYLFSMVPFSIWASFRYGMHGAAAVWMVSNFLYLIIWSPVVHKKFAPGSQARWMFFSALPPFLVAFILAIIFKSIIIFGSSRFFLAVELIIISITLYILVMLASYGARIRRAGKILTNW